MGFAAELGVRRTLKRDDSADMLISAVVMATLSAATPPGGRLDSAAWVSRSPRPSATERRCTDYSLLFWSVSVVNGVPWAVQMETREHVDPLPFSYTEAPDRQGSRHVVRVEDGWLVGFDAGEFGGGLWWFSRDGRDSRRVRPSPSMPANPDGMFHAENVLGLPEVGGERLVLMGLDHLTGRSGRIFRAVSRPQGWDLALVAVLDAAPDVWLVGGSNLLFLTESGLWSTDGVGAQRIHEVELGSLAPTSLVRGPDRELYVGLRHYVLKLVERGTEWTESWLTPATCQTVQLKEYSCECVG